MRKRGTAISCPHCLAESIVRTSEQITPLAREARVMCLNEECGHVFAVQVEIVRTIAPSRIPNPAVSLPVSNQNLRWNRHRSDNDNHPAPANDQAELPPAALDVT